MGLCVKHWKTWEVTGLLVQWLLQPGILHTCNMVITWCGTGYDWNRKAFLSALSKQYLSVKIGIKSSVLQVLKWPSALLWWLSSSSSPLTPSGVQVRPVYWPVKLRNTMNRYWSCWQCGPVNRMKPVSPWRCSGEGRLERSQISW